MASEDQLGIEIIMLDSDKTTFSLTLLDLLVRKMNSTLLLTFFFLFLTPRFIVLFLLILSRSHLISMSSTLEIASHRLANVGTSLDIRCITSNSIALVSFCLFSESRDEDSLYPFMLFVTRVAISHITSNPFHCEGNSQETWEVLHCSRMFKTSRNYYLRTFECFILW